MYAHANLLEIRRQYYRTWQIINASEEHVRI